MRSGKSLPPVFDDRCPHIAHLQPPAGLLDSDQQRCIGTKTMGVLDRVATPTPPATDESRSPSILQAYHSGSGAIRRRLTHGLEFDALHFCRRIALR